MTLWSSTSHQDHLASREGGHLFIYSFIYFKQLSFLVEHIDNWTNLDTGENNITDGPHFFDFIMVQKDAHSEEILYFDFDFLG